MKYKRKSKIKPPKIQKIKGVPWISIHRDNIIEGNMSLLNKYLRRLYNEELEEHISKNEQLNEMIRAHNDCFKYQVQYEPQLIRGEERNVSRFLQLVEMCYGICKDNWQNVANDFGFNINDKISVKVENQVFSMAKKYINDMPPNAVDLDDAISRMHWLISELIMLENKSLSSLDLLKKI